MLPRPLNLGISRQLAVLAALVGVLVAVVAIGSVAIAYGRLDAAGTATLLGTLGMAITALVSALKATEAADTASKAYRTATYTASQAAMIQQLVAFHAGDGCPRPDCPLKPGNGGTA